MSPFNSLQLQRNQLRYSQRIKITHLITPYIAESEDGMLMSTIAVLGLPYETLSNEALNAQKNAWHRALTALNEQLAIHVSLHREQIKMHLTGDFDDNFRRQFDTDYQQSCLEEGFYQNHWYITIIHKGLAFKPHHNSVWQVLSRQALQLGRQQARAQQLSNLHDAISQLTQSLAAWQPHCLGTHDDNLGHSELLAFLSRLFNVGKSFKSLVRQPTIFQSSIDEKPHKYSHYPRGHIGQWLCQQSIYFGRYIQFQGVTKQDNQFGAMLALKAYCNETSPSMFDAILNVPFEYILVNTFITINKQTALSDMKKHIQKMIALDDPSQSQIEELYQARDDLQSDHLKMGWHHQVILIHADSIDALENNIDHLVALCLDQGIVVVRETLGQEAAYWSMMPTHFCYIARSAMINSLNFVDFCSLHNHKHSFYQHNHLSQPMSIAQTTSRAVFYFNLHAKGSSDSPSSGHTLIIGGNGSGKTVAMCFFDAQLSRYGGSSYFFDRDRGCEIYVRACGGTYYALGPEQHHAINLNPFQLPTNQENIQFVKSWFQFLIMRDDQHYLEDTVIAEINDCVDYAFYHLKPEERYLTTVCHRLSTQFPYWDRLQRWLHGADNTPSGEYAYLFDHVRDNLTLNSIMGFDLTHFMDNEPGSIFTAVSMYLLRRIEQQLTGSLVSIFLDEGWQFLGHPYWSQRLKHWLPTLRKRNAHIILATQSPKTVAQSSISHVLLDNCASQIYFANPQAQKSDYLSCFNLTEREYHCVRHMNPAEYFMLYKQAHESCLVRFPMKRLASYLKVFSANTRSVQYCHQLMQKYGCQSENWLSHYMSGSSC